MKRNDQDPNQKHNKTIRRAAMVIYCQSVVIGALLGMVTILWGQL